MLGTGGITQAPKIMTVSLKATLHTFTQLSQPPLRFIPFKTTQRPNPSTPFSCPSLSQHPFRCKTRTITILHHPTSICLLSTRPLMSISSSCASHCLKCLLRSLYFQTSSRHLKATPSEGACKDTSKSWPMLKDQPLSELYTTCNPTI